MSFELDLLELMPDTVTIYPCTGIDFYGQPTFGEGESFRARIVGKGLALRRREGEEMAVVYDVYIHSLGSERFSMDDKLELPDSTIYQDRYPEIFAIGQFPDDQGHHHTKFQCGWTYHRQGQ